MSGNVLYFYAEKLSSLLVSGRETAGTTAHHFMPGILRAFLLVAGLPACGDRYPGLAAGGFRIRVFQGEMK